jgi:hypothetical protein
MLATGCMAHIASNIAVLGVTQAATEVPGTLVLDGLLIEGKLNVRDGDLGQLIVCNTTLGASAAGLNAGLDVLAGNQALSVSIRSCVAGAVRLNTAAGGLQITDSIIGTATDLSLKPAQLAMAVDAANGDTSIARSTVLGRTEARSLEAENTLFMGRARAAQRQQGCVRFCFAPLVSRLPRRFRCQPDLAIEAAGQPDVATQSAIEQRLRPSFSSLEFGAASFAQLSAGCAEDIRSGGEEGAEMGVGFAAGEPFRRQNLADIIDEYLPFGLAAAPIFMN